MKSPTPAPWKWIKRQDNSGKTWDLIHPANGYLVVMDFVRLGMNSGTFRLANWASDERGMMGGLMVPAHEIDLESHPDARLIAGAAAMYAALKKIAEAWPSGDLVENNYERQAIARAALEIVEGKT